MSALTEAKSLSASSARARLGDLGRVASSDDAQALGPERLHAERHERDAAVVQLAHGLGVDVGGVRLDADVASHPEPLAHAVEHAADAVQRERRGPAPDVDARDLGGSHEVGPPVDLGQRRTRVRLDQRGVVGDLRVGAVRAAVAAERDVQVERRALDGRRRPRRVRARELPALLGADEVPAHRTGRHARDSMSRPAHRYLTIPSTALGRSRCASDSSVHAP